MILDFQAEMLWGLLQDSRLSECLVAVGIRLPQELSPIPEVPPFNGAVLSANILLFVNVVLLVAI